MRSSIAWGLGILASLALAAAPARGSAADAARAETAFTRALDAYRLARQGTGGEADAAVAAFEALVRAEPRHPLYAAYLGSALTLKGREAWMPWNKMKWVEQGLDRLDQALAALQPEHDRLLVRGVPAGVEARFVAATTFIALPDGLFHRRAAGKTLMAALLKDPALAGAPAEFRATVQAAAAAALGEGGR